jgi:hypothetical protein
MHENKIATWLAKLPKSSMVLIVLDCGLLSEAEWYLSISVPSCALCRAVVRGLSVN